jgi:hypothetical protein
MFHIKWDIDVVHLLQKWMAIDLPDPLGHASASFIANVLNKACVAPVVAIAESSPIIVLVSAF